MPTKNYFPDHEFACKCGCGTLIINPLLRSELNRFRTWLGQPINISSGFRCRKHNSKVGGKPQSFHLTGSAADIYVKGLSGPQLYLKLLDWGRGAFKGIGIGANFIHVDVRKDAALFFYDGITLDKLHPDQTTLEE